jgi:hypothetical protein
MSDWIFAHLDTTIFLQYMLCCYLRSLEQFSNTDAQNCKYSIARLRVVTKVLLWLIAFEYLRFCTIEISDSSRKRL